MRSWTTYERRRTERASLLEIWRSTPCSTERAKMTAPAAQAARTEAAAAYRRQILEYARRSPGAFCERVLRDEATGAPIRLAPMHQEWMRLIDQHQRLVILSHVESGKSSAITVGRTLFELG